MTYSKLKTQTYPTAVNNSSTLHLCRGADSNCWNFKHYHNQNVTVELLVVRGDGPSLMGRDCLQKIRLDWHSLHQIQATYNTIQNLHTIFSTHGLLEVTVSHNGAPFVSAEFKKFLSKNRVCHTSTPYHPKSNGQAERSVQRLKQALKKSTNSCFKPRYLVFC